jgi:hypothetical protein
MKKDDQVMSDTDSVADPLNGYSRRNFLTHVGMVGVARAALSRVVIAAESTPPAYTQSISREAALINRFSTQENDAMPLVKIDAFEGRSDGEVKALLDAAHRAIVKSFHLNERDRYQIYSAHPKSQFIMQDTGLGIPRTDKALIVTVTSKSRPEILKRNFYAAMVEELNKSASIAPSDVMIAIVENGAADWTFGNGNPQFLTGDLG